jgi:hypothetical protein
VTPPGPIFYKFCARQEAARRDQHSGQPFSPQPVGIIGIYRKNAWIRPEWMRPQPIPQVLNGLTDPLNFLAALEPSRGFGTTAIHLSF